MKPSLSRSILLSGVLLAAPCQLSGQAEMDLDLIVQEHTLDNGLRLFILPRPGVPIVSFVVQYRVGSVNERPGETGIAHLLEHLFFKGTTSIGTRDFGREEPLMEEMDILFDSILVRQDRFPDDTAALSDLRRRIRDLEKDASEFVRPNELDEILSQNGARNLNATTTSEATTYFVELPRNRAELWFALEADRMKNPVFREFYTERDVVAEERRLRMDDNPAGLLYEAHLATAFQHHPYGAPVVGYMEDIQRLSRPEVENYFHSYYGPNNAVVAVAGDVDPQQILQWARTYLEPIPPGSEPPPVRAVEPPQRGERRVEVAFDAEPAVRIGWKVPSAMDEDAPALYMLMSLLTGGRSSRLYQRLVLEERIAAGITASIEPGQLYPGLFTLQATPIRPHTTRDVEEAVYQEIDRLRWTPPEESELQRVRNQLEASEVRRLRSGFGLALQVARSASLFGDWRATFDSIQDLIQVTPQDIQRVVQRYFGKERRTVATLVPVDHEEGDRR
jgi:predicted Zn-dependent peptidase